MCEEPAEVSRRRWQVGVTVNKHQYDGCARGPKTLPPNLQQTAFFRERCAESSFPVRRVPASVRGH